MRISLSRIRKLYSDEDTGNLLGGHLEVVLASLILSAWCAYGAYTHLDRPQAYSELIVGNIAWTVSGKYRDYATLFAFIVGFFVSFVLLTFLSTCLTRNVGVDAGRRFHDFLAMISAPAGLWFAGLLTTRVTDLRNLAVAGVLVATATSFAFVLHLRRQEFWRQDAVQFVRILQKAVLTIAVFGFAVAAVGMLASRGGVVLRLADVSSGGVFRVAVVTMIAAGGVVSALILRSHSAGVLERRIDGIVLAGQFGFAAFFLTLLPAPWRVDGQLVMGYPMSIGGWSFIGMCVAVTLLAVAKRFWTVVRSSTTTAPSELLVLPAAIGLLLFLKTSPVGIPSINPDDYHFGEIVVPWWSMAKQHLIPFWDYSPARGLMNYLPGLTASLFFDGTAATFGATAPFRYVAVLAVAMPAFAATIGRGPAIIALFLAPSIGWWISEIDIVVTAFLCVICGGFLKWSPMRWLVISWCSALVLLLYAPGQGALAILAVVPLALVKLYRALQCSRAATIRMLALILVITGLICVFTPCGKMLVGAVRYGLEQSAVNSIAHGVNWNATFGRADANPWLFEVARCSWLAVALLAGILLFRRSLQGRNSSDWAVAFAFALPILFLMAAFVTRAAGRIDPGASRLGVASIWGLALLLPILVFVVMRPRAVGAAVLAWVSVAGLIVPYFGGQDRYYMRAFEPLNTPMGAPGYVDGRAVGLPQLGEGLGKSDHVDRLIRIQQILDRVLGPDETYLDATGRHATYFYFNRRPPIEAGSIYNLVTEGQQQRAVASMRRGHPPVVLIAADNILFDGGPASLRANLLYRYLLLEPGYKIVKTGNLTWLMQADRIGRLAPAQQAEVADISGIASNPVHEIFRVSNLRGIPASWGRSAATLEPRMQEVKRLPADVSAVLEGVVEDGGSYRVTGSVAHVTFDVTHWQMSGREAGILAFDFACEVTGPPPVIELYWATDLADESETTVVRFNSREGRMLVPLDAAPAWLLADQIKRLRFGIRSQGSSRSFRIENVSVYQRPGVPPKTN